MLLTTTVFLPLLGMLLCLVAPARSARVINVATNAVRAPARRPDLATDGRHLDAYSANVTAGPVEWIPCVRDQLPRRPSTASGSEPAPADRVRLADGRDRVLEHREEPTRLPRHVPAAPHGHARRVRLAGPVPLLRVLGDHAPPDVLPHRDLGRPAPPVRGDQVLPLHAVRVGPAAGRRHPRRPQDRHLVDPRDHRAGQRAHRERLRRRPSWARADWAWRPSSGCSSASRSRSPPSRSTRGCRTRTSRRRRRSP